MDFRVIDRAVQRVVPAVIAFVLVYVLLVLTPTGRAIDAATMFGGFQASRALIDFDQVLLGSITSVSCLLVIGVVLLIATMRGRRLRGFLGATAVLGATLSAEMLKLVLPSHTWRGDQWIIGGSFPSGHTTVAASIALALLSVCSPRWRKRLVGPAIAAVALTATATITMNWHRPADVLGGLVLAYGWHRGVSSLNELRTGAGAPRRLTGVVLGQGGAWALAAAAVIVGVAVHAALTNRVWWQPPWLPEPVDGGSGLVYIGSLGVICLATAATFLLAPYPVSSPVPAQIDLRDPPSRTPGTSVLPKNPVLPTNRSGITSLMR